MSRIQSHMTNLRLLGIFVCVVALQLPVRVIMAQNGLTLVPMPTEAISTDFQWSIDSKSLTFNALGGPRGQDKVRVAYDLTTQTTTQITLDKLPPAIPVLNADEITELSPFIDPASRQPLAFLSPDKKYAVYPSSVGKLDETGTVMLYTVYLAKRATKQVMNTKLLVLDPASSFNEQDKYRVRRDE